LYSACILAKRQLRGNQNAGIEKGTIGLFTPIMPCSAYYSSIIVTYPFLGVNNANVQKCSKKFKEVQRNPI